MPLFCGFISPNTNHYAHLLSSPPPSLDCEPSTHVYPKGLYNSAWWCVQNIYSLNEWMTNEWMNRTPMDFTNIWHLKKHVCMSMHNGICVKRGPWKSGMDGREVFFKKWFLCVCVYILEGKRSQEKHQLICKFVTIVGIGVENIYINSILWVDLVCLREKIHSNKVSSATIRSHRSLFLKSKWLHYVQFLIPKKISVILVKLPGMGWGERRGMKMMELWGSAWLYKKVCG